jgi:hypothetical protein
LLDWEARCQKAAARNYTLSMAAVVGHPLVMLVAYDQWANYNHTLLALSVAHMLLAAFCWAVPDEKY